jgi:hypothetical protein
MVHDDGPFGLDGVRVDFDDERVVADAGIALLALLAGRLGIEGLVERFVRLRRDRPGASNAGRKVIALIYAMGLGADSIDDCELLRAGRTRRLLGGWLPAPSTLGTFLRAFTFGHVRQLARVLARRSNARGRQARARARSASLSTSTASSARSTATTSRAPRSATRAGAATTRCWPRGPTPARSCTCACARARRTPLGARCAS